MPAWAVTSYSNPNVPYTFQEFDFATDQGSGVATGSWISINVSATEGQDLGGNVAQFIMRGHRTDTFSVGVREEGSSLERRVIVDSEETSGYYNYWVSFVKIGDTSGVDNGLVEVYKENTNDQIILEAAYGGTTDWVELWQTITVGSYGSWVDVDVSAYVPAGAVAQFLLRHDSDADPKVMGVRQDGSSYTRSFNVDDLDSGSIAYKCLTMLANVGTSGDVEFFLEDSDCEVILLGYLTGIRFVEQWVEDGASVNGSYQVNELSNYDERIVVYYVGAMHSDTPIANTDGRLGVRINGNTDRLGPVNLADADSGAYNPITFCTQIAPTTKYIQVYESDYSNSGLYISGYFANPVFISDFYVTNPSVNATEFYTAKGSQDVWLFAAERYYGFKAVLTNNDGWDQFTNCSFRWTNVLNTIQVSYSFSTQRFTLVSGRDIENNPIIRMQTGTATNTSNLTVEVTWQLYLEKYIFDEFNADVDVVAYSSTVNSTWITFSDEFNVYNQGGLTEGGAIDSDFAMLPSGPFDIEADNVGDPGAFINITYRNLQHIKFLTEIHYPTARLGAGFTGEWEVWYWIYVCYEHTNGTDYWIPGWKGRIWHSSGYTSPKDFWIMMAGTWWRYDASATPSPWDTPVQQTQYFSFWREAPSPPEGYTTIWTDLWFDAKNYTSGAGGRFQCEYYGMQDATPWWAFWYSNWGPMLSNGTRVTMIDTIYGVDGEGETVYGQQIKMMKVAIEYNRPSGSSVHSEIRHLEVTPVFDNQRPFSGVSIPTPVPEKVMDMPQGGMFGWIIESLKQLLLSDPVLSGWQTFVNFLDTVFTFAGWEDGFSTIVGWIASFLTFLTNSVAWVVDFSTDLFSLFTAMLTTLFNIMGTFVTQWVLLLQATTNILTDGYNSGINFINDFDIASWLPVVGILWIIWLAELFILKGAGPVMDHFSFIFSAFMFLFNVFLGLVNFFIYLVNSLIEAIPVVE